MQTGENSATWGDKTNTNLGTLLEKSIAGTASANVTAGNVTLTTLNGADDTSRCMIVAVSGTPGVARSVIAPSSSKVYSVINGSNAAVTFKGAATTGVTLQAGQGAVVAWNGSDFVLLGIPTASPAPLYTDGFGRVFASSLHNNSAGAAGTVPMLASGTYTPTGTAVTNCSSVAPASFSWQRVGSVVHAAGSMTVGITSSSALTSFALSLPVASNLVTGSDLSGTATFWDAASSAAGICTGDPTNDRATLYSISLPGSGGGSLSCYAQFMYVVG